MPNERLRAALLEHGLTPADLAADVGVDTKSVERWISRDRTPYRKHRYAVAARLGADETFLWPKALSPEQAAEASESEILNIYPHRWTVPRDAWKRLFESAQEELGVLVYSGYFIAEDGHLHQVLKEKAEAGVRVRVLLGDPDSPAVAQRGADEGIGDAMGAKIRNVIVLYKSLRSVDGVEFRLHTTTLYNSIYRADGQLLVNTHIYGRPAADAPVFHLRRIAGGGMVSTYLDSFERVWSEAAPLD